MVTGAVLAAVLILRELGRAGGWLDDEGTRRLALLAAPIGLVFALVVVLRLAEVVATGG